MGCTGVSPEVPPASASPARVWRADGARVIFCSFLTDFSLSISVSIPPSVSTLSAAHSELRVRKKYRQDVSIELFIFHLLSDSLPSESMPHLKCVHCASLPPLVPKLTLSSFVLLSLFLLSHLASFKPSNSRSVSLLCFSLYESPSLPHSPNQSLTPQTGALRTSALSLLCIGNSQSPSSRQPSISPLSPILSSAFVSFLHFHCIHCVRQYQNLGGEFPRPFGTPSTLHPQLDLSPPQPSRTYTVHGLASISRTNASSASGSSSANHRFSLSAASMLDHATLPQGTMISSAGSSHPGEQGIGPESVGLHDSD